MEKKWERGKFIQGRHSTTNFDSDIMASLTLSLSLSLPRVA